MKKDWITRAEARACPIHQAVLEAAIGELTLFGPRFSKDEVLKMSKMMTAASVINWEYIKEFVEQDIGVILVPVGAGYFAKHQKQEEYGDPGHFLAGGHGKKTAGYVSVTKENDHLVVHRVKQRKALVKGSMDAHNDLVVRVEGKRQLEGLSPLQIGNKPPTV